MHHDGPIVELWGIHTCCMLYRVKRVAFIFALCAVALAAGAQEAGSGAFAVIIYADGDSFQLLRDGRPREYDVYHPDVLGLPLYSGDRVDTYEGTYIELQLLPSRSVVKLAENTSFLIEGVASGGGGAFELAYGRVRASVSRASGTDPFEIRSRTTVAGVRGTDFGYDVISGEGNVVTANVYCFEGTVEVQTVTPGEPAFGAAERQPGASVELAAGDMVSVVAQAQEPDQPQRPATQLATRPVEQAIIEFWQSNEFVEEAIEPAQVAERFPQVIESVTERFGTTPEFLLTPEPEPEVMAQPPEPAVAVTAVPATPEAEPEETPEERRERLSNATRVAGLVLMGGGAAVELAGGAILLFGDAPTLERTLLITGGVYFGGGLLSLLASFLISN